MLMRASPQVEQAGIQSSFARFSVAEQARKEKQGEKGEKQEYDSNQQTSYSRQSGVNDDNKYYDYAIGNSGDYAYGSNGEGGGSGSGGGY